MAPGASVGTIEMASLSMAAGSFFDYEFADLANYDQTVVTGALTLPTAGTPVKFNLYVEGTTTPWDYNGTYNLISYGSLTNPFNASMLAVNNGVGGVTYTFQTANVGGTDYVQLVVTGGQNLVPEPATLAFLALGGLAFVGPAFARSRRNRRKA